MKRVLSICVALLLIFLFVGCGTSNNNKEQSTKIIVAEFRALSWLPVHLAYELGYFEEQGLDVEFAVYRDGTLALQGMHANNSQFCLLSQGTIFLGEDQGLRSELVIAMKKNRPFVLATAKSINSIDQLKGKIVFAGLPGSEPYQLVSNVLTNAGLNIKEDITYVNLDYGAALAALGSGQIKASYFGIEYTSDLEKAGVNIVFSTGDPETALEFYGSDKFETDVICCSKEFSKKNPETVQKFVNAVLKALYWVQEHSDAEIAAKITSYYSSMSQEDLALRINYLRPAFSNDGYISKKGFDAVENFFMKYGIPQTKIEYEDIVNMNYLENAQTSLTE
ncbi:MAG: ABC transporter substrate-binding protein [Clostridiaceae bacterium]|jgi:NitT/TauT family transport system substrate-binding protein|nr:ABC transporter substrate-binding protein [Clostridiaceae bacterium]